MDITVQLNKLNGEIDAVNIRIDAQMEKWEMATAEDKAFYERSILRLEDEKKTLIDHRKQLTIANASSSSQGKDIRMAVSPAKLCSALDICELRYSTRVFKCYRFAFAFDLYWCIRERRPTTMGGYIIT